MQVRPLIRLARPRHWVKNVIVLFPVVFAMRVADGSAWGKALLAMLAMCLASSAVYVFNDIRDRQADARHPRKKYRPLPSGQVSVLSAAVFAGVLAACALTVAGGVRTLVGLIVLGYLVLQLAYCLGLKQKMLVDVICIAMGFVLRATAGAAAIGVAASPWLIICAFTLCLFMGFCKRRCEVGALGEGINASEYRRTLAGYTPELLTHLITLSAGIAVVSFMLYATSTDTVARFGTIYLVYTLPVVIYAIFRFAMLSMTGRYDDPTELILRDKPFQAVLLLWAIAVGVVLFGGKWIQGLIDAHY
ncbi:MAG: decaprenyl-phosphate phosphoribosyltransferase [Planctomycetes bacterium]|nr:decaprenyl-phosphate phosphoribosyltransferase [Planctomycetota bacterium]